MNKNTNPWMLATLLLGGFILGFSTAKLIPTIPENNLEARTITNNVQEAVETAPTEAPIDVKEYSKVQTSKDSNGNWTMGNLKAKVVVQEFSDFQCPFCSRYFTGSFPEIFRNYIETGKILYVYANYPLSFHPNAPMAAEAALCAGDQSKYWEMHDLLFTSQKSWSAAPTDDVKTFEKLASGLNLKLNEFNSCLTSKKYQAQVKKDMATGEKYGISGTPTFMINGQKLVGAQPYSVFQQIIDGLLNQ